MIQAQSHHSPKHAGTHGISVGKVTVRRAMETMELLADAQDGLGVTVLAEQLDTDKSVASRLLSSLSADGYVIRDALTDRYKLSLKLFSAALRHADALGFPGVCLPLLQALADEMGELMELTAVDRGRLVYVASVEGKQRLNIRPTIGREAALHATASGKAWLATLPTDRAIALALAAGMTRETSRTNTRIEQLLRELEVVKAQGFAMVVDEWVEGASAVAAPIGCSRFDRAVGTIVMAVPSNRYDLPALTRVGPRLVAAAAELEAIWPMYLGMNATDGLAVRRSSEV